MNFLINIYSESDPVLILGLISFFLLLISLPISLWSALANYESFLVRIFLACSNFCLASQLVFRWIQSAHFPISNLYESLCFLTWASTLSLLLVDRAWPSPLIFATGIPFSLLSIGFASFALPSYLQTSSPLVPALRSSWLIMHVSVIMCSYAALIAGSILSFAVLFTDRDTELQIRNNSVGVGGFRSQLSSNININNSVNSFEIGPVKLSNSEQLDSLSYRAITVGFLLLTIGLISGAVWANEAWGSWWSWDPKETWALICWLVYASYLHIRLVRGWQGRKPAIIAIAGFFVIVVCYIGVNLLGIGLHSYGWFF